MIEPKFFCIVIGSNGDLKCDDRVVGEDEGVKTGEC